jgi:hypothetical protein
MLGIVEKTRDPNSQGPRAQPAHFKFSWPTIPAWKVKMIMSIFGKPVETLEFYLGLEGYTRYTR